MTADHWTDHLRPDHSPVPGFHQRGRSLFLLVFALPFLVMYPILPTTALKLEPGAGASTVWLHARLERDSDGDLETVKAGFENIAEGDKVFHLIRELQGKTDD